MSNGTGYQPSTWGRFGRGLLIGAGVSAGLFGVEYVSSELPGMLKGTVGAALGGVALIFVNVARDWLLKRKP